MRLGAGKTVSPALAESNRFWPTTLLSTSEMSTIAPSLDAHLQLAHRFSYHVNRTGNHDEAGRSGRMPSFAQSRGDAVGYQDFPSGAVRGRTNLVRAGRPRVLGPRGDDSFAHWEQDLGYLRYGLVAHCAKDDGEQPFAVIGRERCPQRPGTCRVVRDVKHDLRPIAFCRDNLEPAWPASLAKSTLDGI